MHAGAAALYQAMTQHDSNIEQYNAKVGGGRDGGKEKGEKREKERREGEEVRER